ncbi:MAG: B12-binding domain-containing radical SAM protein [Blautia sp.]|nr:B12-binding domain-containing radical SAM protein [Blautia sp.]
MKVLLLAVNAKYIHSNLAVYSLKAYAGKEGYQTEILECTINQSKDQILKGIYERKPDLLCVSCYIWNISYIEEILSDAKKVLPDVPIWVGGPEVSYDAEAFLERHKEVKGVMCGEGEKTLTELLEWYETGQGKLEEIPGIVCRIEGNIVAAPPRAIMDMDQLIFPYENFSDFSHKIIYYESSRGCPFSCSYCLSSIDKKLRFRSLSLVEKELEIFLKNCVPQVKFVDRTFNCKKDHAMAIWQYIKDHDNGVTNFHFEVAADLLTEEEIQLIHTMRPGLIQLEIGVQSTNTKTLEAIHRKTSFEEITKKVQAVQSGKNVHQHLDLIAGLPYEDYESFRKSFNDVYRLRPEQLQLGFLKVLKGSYMAEAVGEYQCRYKSAPPYEVLHTRWLDYGEMLRLKGVEEMVEVYYNSGQFSRIIEVMETLFTDAFSMYEALADFYEKNGYMDISHTRIRRYEILQEFLQEKEGNQEYFRQLMLFDLYARENMKTRPDWACDLSPYKKQIQEFYKREEEHPVLLTGYEGYQARQTIKMTHLEVFSYDVMNRQEKSGLYPVLFDYSSRSPLTNDAKAVRVNLQEMDTCRKEKNSIE